jgi:hypothetical protein
MFILIENGFLNKILNYVMTHTFPSGEFMLALPGVKTNPPVHLVVVMAHPNPTVLSADGAGGAVCYGVHICS